MTWPVKDLTYKLGGITTRVWNVPWWWISRWEKVGAFTMCTLRGFTIIAPLFCSSPSWGGSTKKEIFLGYPQVCSRAKLPFGPKSSGPSCLAPAGPPRIKAEEHIGISAAPLSATATPAGSWGAIWWVLQSRGRSKKISFSLMFSENYDKDTKWI